MMTLHTAQDILNIFLSILQLVDQLTKGSSD